MTRKPTPQAPEPADHAIQVHLDDLLVARGMTLTELSLRTGTTIANLSVLKNGHARAVRFTTLTAICQALACQPGDILTFTPDNSSSRPPATTDTSPLDSTR